MFIILFILLSFASAVCPNTNDPLPSGGAPCTSDAGCNGANRGGVCSFDGPTPVCKCGDSFGKPNCTYPRISKDLAGGLNIGLVFVGVGGVGNFIIGRIGMAVGQLILLLSYYALYCGCCCMFCCDGAGSIAFIVIYILAGCGYLAGFIWSIVDGATMINCGFTDSLGYALY